MGKMHWVSAGQFACNPPKGLHAARGKACSAAEFRARWAGSPDLTCTNCARAARLALAKESAPKPEPPKSTGPLRCSTKGCGSYAVNPEHHGRTYGVDLDLCDVCYWRKRAESATWPKPRPISEAPTDGSRVDSRRLTRL